ncbi:MAG: phosphoribosylformylglycinamidine synthase subunit PurQ [Dehalococcoidia bacterium]|nr:phosphoribosylformylglycinamidine synthase subunit PurQ [Dehalococcoidia bacterium]
MRFGIIVYPGTWSDTDCYHALHDCLEQEAEYVWHKDKDLSKFDAVVVPGGFSYGDYLRCGAIARFSPVTESIQKFADQGRLVIGICNGFQILCEAGLLPGALLRNEHLEFRCQWTNLRVENPNTPFSNLCKPGQVLRVPISHGEGRYYADPDTLMKLEMNDQVVFRYSNELGRLTADDNPNGAANNIAGIINAKGNVLGMMPHPERAMESILGSTDGVPIFASMLRQVIARPLRK